MKPRLVKSQREMEGRFEDVWVLVDEEDDLETWPDDAELAVVGRPATRHDAPLRAGGGARYTVDVALPGMLHARVLRAPVARCRVTALDLEAARRTPGVRTVLGPDGPFTMSDDPPLSDEPAWAGQPIAVVAAETPEAAEAGLLALAPVLDERPPLPLDEGLAEQRFTEEPREVVRGDPGGRAGRGDLRDARARPDPPRAARRGRPLGRRRSHRLDLDTGHLRRPQRARRALRARARARPCDLRVHRRRIRREAGRGG